MSDLLKGNYKLPKTPRMSRKNQGSRARGESPTQEFERRALSRLGGSIAFVIKKDEFVWKGGKSSDPNGSKKERH